MPGNFLRPCSLNHMYPETITSQNHSSKQKLISVIFIVVDNFFTSCPCLRLLTFMKYEFHLSNQHQKLLHIFKAQSITLSYRHSTVTFLSHFRPVFLTSSWTNTPTKSLSRLLSNFCHHSIYLVSAFSGGWGDSPFRVLEHKIPKDI